jgi:MFS transporter, DHA3 family, macrolide efflux protein
MGTGLTAFALSVWVFKTTNDPTVLTFQASVVAFAYIFISFFSGAIVDSFNRKKVILCVDSIAFLNTLLLIYIISTGSFNHTYFYIYTFISAVFNAIQMNAFITSIPLLVEKDQLFKAHSYSRTGSSLTFIVAPLLGVWLFKVIGIHGVIIIDISTFVIASVILLTNSIPSVENVRSKVRVFGNIFDSYKIIMQNKELKSILSVQSISNIFISTFLTIVVPLVLLRFNENALSLVLFVGSSGSFIGSIVTAKLTINDGNRSNWTYLTLASIAFLIMISGFALNEFVFAVSYFLILSLFPILGTVWGSQWQKKAPEEYLGRLEACKSLTLRTIQLMATFIAGLIMAKESSILNFDVYINVEDGVLGLGICLLVFALYKLIRVRFLVVNT